MGELERLDHDLVATRVQVAGLELDRPRVAEHPPLNRLALLVDERDRDVAPKDLTVPDGLPPLEKLGATREAASG